MTATRFIRSLPRPRTARPRPSRLAAWAPLALAALFLAWPAAAFELDWPVDCVLWKTCVIQQYPDQDPDPMAKDYRCGSLSYDGHTGTDIRLPSLAEMKAGVAVLAAAPGRVEALRDGMADVDVRRLPKDALAGRGCGNGVLISHEHG